MNTICRVVLSPLTTSALLCSVLMPPTFAQPTPPEAPVRKVTDTYFETQIVDPYRWLENLSDPEVKTWIQAQNTYTRSVLDRLPGRDELLQRLNQLSNANVSVSQLQRVGNQYFYYKIQSGENDRKLYTRTGLTGSERLLVDPQALSTPGKRYSLMAFSPSQNGQYVSFLLSPGGSEDGELRVLEVATGRDLGVRIDDTRWDAGSWLPDNRSFVYFRLQKLAPGAPAIERFQRSRVYLHTLGSDPTRDKLVFGYGVTPEMQADPTLMPFVTIAPGTSYAIAALNSGVSPNSAFYVAPITDLTKSPIPWRKVADFDDEVATVNIHDDALYLLTYKDTPRYKVIRTNLANPTLKDAKTVVPASEAVVTGIATAQDALYVQTLDGGIGKLWRVAHQGGAPERVELTYDGTISDLTADPRLPGVLFRLESWTKSPTYYQYDLARRAIADTQLQPRSPIDFSQIEAVRVQVPSHDGTLVPLSIMYKRGLRRDGRNPALMVGYGAYGISLNPSFDPNRLAWLERGGVFAVAHVRGGGEYGEDWHLAGKQLTKMNTIRDFIACAEYLIREQFTSAASLAGRGGSAGGILIGGAIAQRPDLFGAAVINVGVLNALRAETTPNGVPNIPEFGTVKTRDGFTGLLAMDAYHRVQDGVAYPAVLLATGINDARVEPWMSAKMTARLQAATTSGKPVLLRIDYDAGHGIGSTRLQRNEELADTYAFLLHQLGAGKTGSGK